MSLGDRDGEAEKFWAPGSTLRTNVNTDHLMAYGMPSTAYARFWAENQVYQTETNPHSQDMPGFATSPKRDILQCGWLEGEDFLAEEAAALSGAHGEGDVVLLGFRPQFRHTTYGTFKFIVNALVDRPQATAQRPTAPASNR